MRRALIAALAVVLFVAVGASAAYRNLQGQIKTQDISDLLGDRPSDGASAPSDSYEGRAVNILVMGSDSRDGQVVSSDGTEGMRSDTAMIVHLSADRKRMDVVSIPRDTMVDIPSCTLPDGSTSEEQSYAMFNSAFSTGVAGSTKADDVKYAAACTVKTVEKLTGVYVDEYAVVDFTGFETMVDALGGVPMYISEDIDDDKADLHLKAGCQTLTGAEALGYARARYSIGDGSDLSRIGRQQQLVAAIMRTALSKNLLTDLPTLYKFMQSALATLTVSPNIGNLTTLAGLARSVDAIGLDNINFVTMPNETDPYNANHVVPSDAAAGVWTSLKEDKAISAENVTLAADGTSPSQAAQAATTAPAQDTATTQAPAASATTQAPATKASAKTTEPSSTATTVDPATQCH